MATTKAQELIEVRAMITTILTGAQSYADHQRSANLPSLETLYKREKELETLIQREADGGIKVRGVTPVDGA